ncbi:hypothetical protein pipiens_012390 [Culex pipiens pipiens]|uniref:Uncharacterized protein n=1 Tax=Culex pipiens pipiens TaxID=38569 RepID=A0ABD1D2I2_CULPP
MFPRRDLKKSVARDARRSDRTDRTGLRCHVVMRFFAVAARFGVLRKAVHKWTFERCGNLFAAAPLDKCDH